MSVYRSSTGELGHYDEPPRRAGGGERWDREKFERAGRRGRDEHERFHFEDHDHVGRHHHDIEFDRHVDRRGPRVIERERFHEDDHVHTPPRRHRTDFFDESTASEVANRALAPYRRKSVVERDILDVAPTAPRRPARPQYLRRTSSLDTFDRRPMRRYGDHERIERVERKEDWRPPANVPIPLPIRERRRSPSRMRVREEDFEEIRYRDREPREEYREVEIRRDKSTTRRRSRSRRAVSVARTSRSSSLSSFEEISPPKQVGKKGKTRMPKRLVKKQAIIELGYPFEEDDDFIIVRRALEKEQIDEVIKISENYKDEKIMYVYEDRQESIAAPPPPPPPPADVHAYHVQPAPPPSVHYAQSIRSSSPSRHAHETFEERFEESSHIHGPLTVLVPDKRRDHHIIHDRDIKDEIQALETERRLLKYERERDSDYEIIERREPRREVIRVEKDRKGRRPANPKVIAAMMTTLT